MKQFIKLKVIIIAAVLLTASGTALAQTDRGTARVRAQEARQTSQQRVEAIKLEVQTRRTQIKQEVCERREAQLQQKIPHLANSSKRLLGVIDKIYTRVQGFVAGGQLTDPNYDTLKANVDAKQADATAAVEALGEFEFELDCANPNIAEQLDGFRTAVRGARAELKEYRKALVELISSLRAQAAEDNAQNGGDGNGTTE